MSAPSSPVWTWPLLGVQRRLPVVARTSAAAVLRGSGGLAGISGLAGPPPAAVPADVGRQDHSGSQRDSEQRAHHWLACDLDSVSVTMARPLWLLPALLLATSVAASAQVEKAAMRTTGISCGSCAVFSEIYLRQLPEIDTISISRSKEAVLVSYKPGASFRPQDLRDALKRTDVGVVQFQISV